MFLTKDSHKKLKTEGRVSGKIYNRHMAPPPPMANSRPIEFDPLLTMHNMLYFWKALGTRTPKTRLPAHGYASHPSVESTHL